jgi:hypothetical protein
VIPKPSAQCSRMLMITSGSHNEPKNEQQAAGHSQSSFHPPSESVLVFAYASVGISMAIPIT